MEQLAGGDLEAAIPSALGQDEIGAMAKAVQVFKDNATRISRHRGRRAAQRDRAERERRAQFFSHVADEFEATVGSVVGAVSGVRGHRVGSRDAYGVRG